jgi:hypothetical protein
MNLVSAGVRPNGPTAPTAGLRLLAEAVVAVQHTLGTGGEQDNRALDERSGRCGWSWRWRALIAGSAST